MPPKTKKAAADSSQVGVKVQVSDTAIVVAVPSENFAVAIPRKGAGAIVVDFGGRSHKEGKVKVAKDDKASKSKTN